MEMSIDMLQGKKIYLRPITMDDTETIVKWRNNERVRRNFIYREVFTKEVHENWMKTRVASGEVIQFIICRIEDDRPVGSVYLRDVDKDNSLAEYGIFIGEDDAIGLGYGNEAAELMCSYADEKMHLKKLILRLFSDNIPARKSYEHAGFSFKEDLPGVVCSDGEVRDMILMERNTKAAVSR